MEKKANLNNTVITMITPKLLVRLLQKIQRDLILIKEGIWKFNVNTFYIYLVEINELEEYNIETEYLYLFSEYEKLKEGLKRLKEIKYPSKKWFDFLYKRYYIRYSSFEQELPEELKMPKVYQADITDLVAPIVKEWEKKS